MLCIFLIGCTEAPILENPSKISRNEMHFFHNGTQIDLDNYTWVYFNDSETVSMYPAIKKNSHAIGLEVEQNTQINIGDIVLFKVAGINDNYVHRVIERGYDDYGEYFITKGDNNRKKDNVKLRRSHISYIIAAVIY